MSVSKTAACIRQCFAEVPDPRREHGRLTSPRYTTTFARFLPTAWKTISRIWSTTAIAPKKKGMAGKKRGFTISSKYRRN